MHAGLEREGGVGVAQVMEADPGQLGTTNAPVELPADVLGMQWGAVLAGEYQVGGALLH